MLKILFTLCASAILFTACNSTNQEETNTLDRVLTQPSSISTLEDIFTPTQELRADEEVIFPIDI